MDDRDQRIAELEDRIAVLEDWAQKTSKWMAVLAQQDALIARFLPIPDVKNTSVRAHHANLLKRADANYRTLNGFAKWSEDENEQSD